MSVPLLLKDSPTELLMRHHWRRRRRAAIFFVPLIESESKYDRIGRGVRHHEKIVLVERLFATAAGSWRTFATDQSASIFGTAPVAAAADFMVWCGTSGPANAVASAHVFNGNTSGNLKWLSSIWRYDDVFPLPLLLDAVIEAVSYDLLDDEPDTTGVQDALRALLKLGRLERAVDLADQRLPKPVPEYRNEAPVATGRYTGFGRKRR